MAQSMTALANITLGASVTSVSFSSISQAYSDLVLVISNVAASSSTGTLAVRFNSDTGTNYNDVFMYSNGSTASSVSDVNIDGIYPLYIGYAVSSTAMARLNIMDYSTTNKHKSVLVRGDDLGTSRLVAASTSRWANTAAITSIQVAFSIAPVAGATLALYGVSA